MNEKKKHIVLIGFKNVGKTVIGKMLAERLGRTFMDLDAEVEKRQGMRVREMVEKGGEAKFRKIESEQLRKVLASTEPLVLALGGGTPMLTDNQKLISEHNVVLITARKSTVFARVMKGGRPPFFPKGGSDRESFEKIYAQREPVYARIAHIKVRNERSVEDAVAEILEYSDITK